MRVRILDRQTSLRHRFTRYDDGKLSVAIKAPTFLLAQVLDWIEPSDLPRKRRFEPGRVESRDWHDS